MRYLSPVISLILLFALIFVLNTKLGPVPPLGKFFDPQAGFWANAETSAPKAMNLKLDGLKEEVTVYFDNRRVPHIFAENDDDLYFAQGYITARDRLFQMEIQSYDASGRLSEIVGEMALPRDLKTRRTGMAYGAELAAEYMMADSLASRVLQAYTAGANAYISSLSPKKYPLEYKILDFKPEVWSPLRTAHLLKAMTETLAGHNNDIENSNTLQYFGEEFMHTMFEVQPELSDPIIPAERKWDFEAVPVKAPDSLFVPSLTRELPNFNRPEGVGSNNWAVSGSKTKSGYPILANDPHLHMTLPSIWYEVQLHAPGINSYGVSLQGVPGVIIGYNEDTAWGVTNVAADVMDWYEIEFRDSTKQEYRHDGQWKASAFRVEEIKIRGKESLRDTVVYTHHGPVSKVRSRENPEQAPAYYALRWIAHEPSAEIKTFYRLNRAKNYDDYVKALEFYTAPAQNFVFADNEGDIALWVNGKFPNKWPYQGRTVSDGTDPLYDWQGWIPHAHNPHIKNPQRGFVSSANQVLAAPDYPYYLGEDFAPYERGRRINDRLAEMENITVQDMQHLQMDNFSYQAATDLPAMLSWLNKEDLTAPELEKLVLLENWDYFNDAEKEAPSIFRSWWNNLYNAVFEDEYGSTPEILRYPSRDRVAEILKSDPEFAFIDDVSTRKKESLADIATDSYKKTLRTMTEQFGTDSEEWQWGYFSDNRVEHLAGIPGLGTGRLFAGGGAESVNATRGAYGPSWRMVVELGPEVKGYGVYPGGASGNPGSPDYDIMVEPWLKGRLFELEFMKTRPTDYLYKIEFK